MSKRLRNILQWTLVLAAFACLESPLFGQAGGIRGVVTDASGAVIPSVNITVTNVASGVAQKVTTNQSGIYEVPFLNPGTYRVEAAKQGFTAVTRDNLKIDVEQTARVDFTLSVGALAQTVNVSEAAALLDSQSSVVGQVITNRSIVELPLNGRNYLDLARL